MTLKGRFRHDGLWVPCHLIDVRLSGNSASITVGRKCIKNGRKWEDLHGTSHCESSLTHATLRRSITVLGALAKGNHSASRRRENGGANEINSMQEDECSLRSDFHQPVFTLPESLWRLLGDRCDAAGAGRVTSMFRQSLWRFFFRVVPTWLLCWGFFAGAKMALLLLFCRKLFT